MNRRLFLSIFAAPYLRKLDASEDVITFATPPIIPAEAFITYIAGIAADQITQYDLVSIDRQGFAHKLREIQRTYNELRSLQIENARLASKITYEISTL